MKIERKGNKLIAYYTDESEFVHPNNKIGDSTGEVSLKTGKFIGATVHYVELMKKYYEYEEQQNNKFDALIDRVIEQVKKDVADGDLTVIDELLRLIPIDNLIQSLPEEEWKDFK